MPEITNAENIQHWSTVPRSLMEEIGDDGDFARRYLLTPAILAMLGETNGKTILDAGCGQGYLCRLLARRGATVTGLEPAAPLFEYAEERERKEGLGIRYIQADLSTFTGGHLYDAVIANAVLMDIPDYLPAISSCLCALRSGGSFVFSVTHPCFEGTAAEFRAKGCVAVSEYFAEYPIQQRFGYSFHRPLSSYLNAVVASGGILREIVEPRLDPAHAKETLELERDLHVPTFIVVHATKA